MAARISTRAGGAGWDEAGFNDAEWAAVKVVDGPGGKFWSRRWRRDSGDADLCAVKQTEVKPGELVYDLGQNFAGWPEIEVRGRRARSEADTGRAAECGRDGVAASLRVGRVVQLYAAGEREGEMASAVRLLRVPLCAGGVEGGTGEDVR